MMQDSSTDIEARQAKALGMLWKMKNLWNNNTIPLWLKTRHLQGVCALDISIWV